MKRFMETARFNCSIRPVRYWAGLTSCFLLFAAGVMAQDAFEGSHASGDTGASYLNAELRDDLLILSARNVRFRNVLAEMARQCDLTIISHAALDTRITLEIEGQPCFEALDRIMRGRSYQLNQVRAASDAKNAILGGRSTLWVFSDARSSDPDYLQAGGRGVSDNAAAIEVLQSQLMSDEVRVRQEAIKGLRRLKVNEVIAPLSYALTDNDKDIRVKAIYALADIGGDDAVAVLAAASSDENAWVRAETAYALGTLGGETAIQVLQHALNDANREVQESAISAFTEIGGEQSARALAIALQDADASLRLEAVEALGNIGGETAMRLLDQALQDQDNAVRKAANEALTELLSHDL